VRLLRQFALGLALFAIVSVAETTPYLGLPFEPKAIALQCYDQAWWNGRVFVKTGRFLCLPETQTP